MSILTEDLHATLLEMLTAKKGIAVTVNSLSKRLKIGTPALRAELVAMGPIHNVRLTVNGRHMAFMIPTEDMMRQEKTLDERLARNTFQPLRRRTDHAAALARARASHLDLVKEPA